MSPANIEAKVKASSPLIGQAIAIGDGRPYNVALITLDPDVAPGFIEQNGREAVEAEVRRGVEAANEQLARVEGIKKFKLLDAEWQPGGEELTPTMKLKRKPIHEKYAAEIEELYAVDPPILRGSGLQAPDRRRWREDRRRGSRRRAVDDEDGDRRLRRDDEADSRDRRRGRRSRPLRRAAR